MARPEPLPRHGPHCTDRRWLTASRVGLLLALLVASLSGPADAAPTSAQVDTAVRLRDYGRAATLLIELAEGGDPQSQYRLAALYRIGRGVAASDAQAARWYTQAARQGHGDAQYNLALLYLKGRGVEVDAAAARRWLSMAVAQGHEAAARRLRQLQPQVVEVPVATGDRFAAAPGERAALLRRAAAAGDARQVAQLLNQGTAIDAVDQYGRSALVEAASNGRLAVTRMLLARGANVELVDRFGDNALLTSAAGGAHTMLLTLLDYGARIDSRDRNANTALMLAAARGHRQCVELLLARGADPNRTNTQGDKARDLAPSTDRQLIALLARLDRHERERESGAARSATARLQRSEAGDSGVYAQWAAPMLAAWRRQHELLAAIIARGDDLNIVDAEGHSPLTRAVYRGDLETVAMLLDAGAQAELPDVATTALMTALNSGARDSVAIATRLIDAGADVNRRDAKGVPALVLAVEKGDASLVERMLASGAAPESADNAGVTALMHAAHNGDVRVVALLLGAGASIATVDLQGRQPLEHAVDGTSTEVMQQLFAAGSKPQVGVDGSNLFHRVARSGSGVLIPILLNHEVKSDVPDLRGNTPLMVAAALGHNHVLEVLLALEAAVDYRNADGNTALHLAVANSRTDTVRALLAHGADPRTRNHNGENATTLARAVGDAALIEAIEKSADKRWLGLF